MVVRIFPISAEPIFLKFWSAESLGNQVLQVLGLLDGFSASGLLLPMQSRPCHYIQKAGQDTLLGMANGVGCKFSSRYLRPPS